MKTFSNLFIILYIYDLYICSKNIDSFKIILILDRDEHINKKSGLLIRGSSREKMAPSFIFL